MIKIIQNIGDSDKKIQTWLSQNLYLLGTVDHELITKCCKECYDGKYRELYNLTQGPTVI
jgi:hypothetical protein